jgi:TRAP-type C4-dicarboxylate transport system permease small subunit
MLADRWSRSPMPHDEPSDISAQVADAGRRQELDDPDRGLPRGDVIVNRLAEAFGVVLLGSVVLIVFVNALMRYMLNTSIIWAEEVVLGLVPWLAMSGLFLAIRRHTMIQIDYFFESLPPAIQPALLVLGQAWAAAVFGYVAVTSIIYLQLFGADRTPYLGLPKGIFAVSLLVGALAAIAAFVLEVWRTAKRGCPS